MDEWAHEAARQLVVALEALGVEAMQRDAVVDIPSIAMQVRIAEADLHDGGVSVVYDLGARGTDREGLRILAVGYGDTPELAFGEAAFQWTTGVFTVVRHWLQPSQHTCFAESLSMTVRNEDTSEEFAWRVHIGPVLSRVFGSDENAQSLADPARMFRVLFDDIHPHAAHRTLFWIEAFAIRYSNGNVDVTCRLRNEPWPAGDAALRAWAAGWNEPMTVSVRQFLLFEPVATTTPWWKRIFSRPS